MNNNGFIKENTCETCANYRAVFNLDFDIEHSSCAMCPCRTYLETMRPKKKCDRNTVIARRRMYLYLERIVGKLKNKNYLTVAKYMLYNGETRPRRISERSGIPYASVRFIKDKLKELMPEFFNNL